MSLWILLVACEEPGHPKEPISEITHHERTSDGVTVHVDAHERISDGTSSPPDTIEAYVYDSPVEVRTAVTDSIAFVMDVVMVHPTAPLSSSLADDAMGVALDRSWIPSTWQHCPMLGFESRTRLSYAHAIRLEWRDGRTIDLDAVCVLNPVITTTEGLLAIAIPHEQGGLRVQVRLGPIPRPYIAEWWVWGGRAERVILSDAPLIVWEYADV